MVSITDRLTVEDVEFEEKNVLIRVDYNVPVVNGKITDTFRIVASLPTLKLVLSKSPKRVFLVSHRGRPTPGKSTEADSFLPILAQIKETFVANGVSVPLVFSDQIVTGVSNDITKHFPERTIVLFENVRFRAEETKPGDPNKLAKELSRLADVFVLDAFACAHRAHTSIARLSVPVRCAGLLMGREFAKLESFTKREANEKTAVVLGGAKVSDKIRLIKNLSQSATVFLIGGAMANTFLFHKTGKLLGDSKVEKDSAAAEAVRETVAKVEVVLPSDFVCQTGEVLSVDAEWTGKKALDVGPQTLSAFKAALAGCTKVFWNGPLGLFEDPKFATGTFELLQFLSEQKQLRVVIGGGDTASAAHKMTVAENIYVSTGGGASLEVLEGKVLPGLEALSAKE